MSDWDLKEANIAVVSHHKTSAPLRKIDQWFKVLISVELLYIHFDFSSKTKKQNKKQKENS